MWNLRSPRDDLSNGGNSAYTSGTCAVTNDITTSVRQQHGFVDFLPHHPVAFAGALFDRRSIEDFDLAARITDQSRFLQRVSGERDRGSLAMNEFHIAAKEADTRVVT